MIKLKIKFCFKIIFNIFFLIQNKNINIRLVMVHRSCISAHCSSMTNHDLTCCKEKSSHDYWSWNTANTWVLHYHFWPMTSVKGWFQNIKLWFRFPISRRYLVYEQLGCTREWALICDEFPKNIISKCPGRSNVFFRSERHWWNRSPDTVSQIGLKSNTR